MTTETPELLVMIDLEDRIVRVFDSKPIVHEAVRKWREHDAAYIRGDVSDADYKPFDEFMDEHIGDRDDVRWYTTDTQTL